MKQQHIRSISQPHLLTGIWNQCPSNPRGQPGFLAMLIVLGILWSKSTFAAYWVPVSGNVYLGSMPVCALVLINGQTQFSCDGTGRYDMQVPVDDNGMITVMSFADGFSPFKQIVTPEQAAEYQIDMQLDQQSPAFVVDTAYEPTATEGRFLVSGAIHVENFLGIPVCALTLANGESMFTCNENLGQFVLDVPLDKDGNITLMAFASGFKPYKLQTNVVRDTDEDNIQDYLDYDDDNDGIEDFDDECPRHPWPNCHGIVLADGKEWLQLNFFTNLSWSEINAVCPAENAGICFGSLNGHDLTSWTWASASEVRALFDYFSFRIPTPQEAEQQKLGPGFLIAEQEGMMAWSAAGWLPTDIGCPFECIYAYSGYTRDSFAGAASQSQGHIAYVSAYGSLVAKEKYSSPLFSSPDSKGEGLGGWFYRNP